MNVLKLVTIDLRKADLDHFESYENEVLPLMNKHRGSLELCVRSIDGMTETHLLYFPDAMRFEAFLCDPRRKELQHQWQKSGAESCVTDVEHVVYS